MIKDAERSNPVALPNQRQLWRSTFVVVAIAALLFLTAVLPAEYGMDPTGVGNLTGLKQMGEIKQQLANGAARLP